MNNIQNFIETIEQQRKTIEILKEELKTLQINKYITPVEGKIQAVQQDIDNHNNKNLTELQNQNKFLQQQIEQLEANCAVIERKIFRNQQEKNNSEFIYHPFQRSQYETIDLKE